MHGASRPWHGDCTLLVANQDRTEIQFIVGKPEREKEEFDMPHGDRTGPTGTGPKTGRMRGFCMGFGAPGTFNRSPDFVSPGRGGGGRGCRNRFFNTGRTGWQRSAGFSLGRGTPEFADAGSDVNPGPRLETLKAQAQNLEKALDGIKRRIQGLESGTEQNLCTSI